MAEAVSSGSESVCHGQAYDVVTHGGSCGSRRHQPTTDECRSYEARREHEPRNRCRHALEFWRLPNRGSRFAASRKALRIP